MAPKLSAKLQLGTRQFVQTPASLFHKNCVERENKRGKERKGKRGAERWRVRGE